MTSISTLLDDHELAPDKIRPVLGALQANSSDLHAFRGALNTLLPLAAVEILAAELEFDPSVLELWEKELKLAIAKSELLSFLHWAQDGLQFCDVYSLARLAGLCTDMPQVIIEAHLWESKVLFLSNCWLAPLSESFIWKDLFFNFMRPRWDGIYIGYCGYLRRIAAGSSLTDARRRLWNGYRRYLRLCPPDDAGVFRGLILQDACPSDVAVEVLLNLDPQTHSPNPKPVTICHQSLRDTKAQLAAKTSPFTYNFQDGHIHLRWDRDGEYHASMKVGHHKMSSNFSEQLEWTSYYCLHTRGDLTHFDLGRTVAGDAIDADSQHFAPFSLRPCNALAHLL